MQTKATVKVDKSLVRKAHLVDAIGSWEKKPDLSHTQELMNAVRAYRRQLRKRTRKLGAKRAS